MDKMYIYLQTHSDLPGPPDFKIWQIHLMNHICQNYPIRQIRQYHHNQQTQDSAHAHPLCSPDLPRSAVSPIILYWQYCQIHQINTIHQIYKIPPFHPNHQIHQIHQNNLMGQSHQSHHNHPIHLTHRNHQIYWNHQI